MNDEKKSMAQLLRQLDINEKKMFALIRKDSVLTTIQRLKCRGYRFKCKTDIDKGCCVITKLVNPK